ncbi:MAG: linear amide C-N hydrolase [Anaerolineales bacterium]|nr:linear amide C-N hydrolase [Anaerolineales bacterium]
MKRQYYLILASATFLIGLVIPGCAAAPPTAQTTLSPEQQTLASLELVDDFPLYVMHYYGDYGFESLLGQGATSAEGQNRNAIDLRWSCSCFAAMDEEGKPLLGRNFDWYHDHPALLLFTDPPAAYASVSMVDLSYLGFSADTIKSGDRSALLQAPYLPFDGMNEYGLAVGMMAVDRAEGGQDSQKLTLGTLEIIRLMLDYARNVDEALALLDGYNVDFEGGPPVHYLIADAAGESALVEYLDHEIVVTRSAQTWQVATNFIFADEQPAGADSSCWRYNKAYDVLEQHAGVLSAPKAMDLLEQVSQSGDFPTIWSLVYHLQTGEIEVVIDRQYHQVYDFTLEMNTAP